MTDKELLELAAKAAGFVQPHSYREKTNSLLWLSKSGFPATWSPLTDDGDALRLAVKLKLTVQQNEMSVYAFTHNGTTPYAETNEVHRNEIDPYTATRRAIVRAAAEIGRGAP